MKVKGVQGVIDEVCEEICNKYCKWPESFTTEEWKVLGLNKQTPCYHCPLDRLGYNYEQEESYDSNK